MAPHGVLGGSGTDASQRRHQDCGLHARHQDACIDNMSDTLVIISQQAHADELIRSSAATLGADQDRAVGPVAETPLIVVIFSAVGAVDPQRGRSDLP